MGVPIYISNPSSPLCLTITIRTMRYVTNDASKIPAERHVFHKPLQRTERKSSCINVDIF